ncbi:tyrosine-type recombinase/integrase [Paenochrobactrum sp. BZR 588]|uniref:tyrosine-type recombinase/integrase n=1 Tax=unclassified Paenochrobactrum TaxID=2639760 RepID=UPI0038543733
MTNIELPYIEKNKSRHGTMRYYLRIDGRRICRLPDDIGSEEFIKKYWQERNNIEVKKTKAKPVQGHAMPVKPYSFRWLCIQYLTSEPFFRLDETTKAKRRAIIDAMLLEPLTENDPRLFADIPLSKMTASHIEVLKIRKRDTPFAADERLKILRQIFDTKKDAKQIVPNIAKGVEAYRIRTDGHATATATDLAKFIEYHGAKSKASLYLAIQMYTGFRVSDLAVLGEQHRKNDEFRLRLFKNRNKTPVDIIIPLHPILIAVLDSHEVTGSVYLQTEYNKPYSVKGLGNRISDWFKQAGLGHLTSHSVRKGLATDQAHNEATDNMLEAMFGWRDAKTSKIYTKNAERARLARSAVAKINWDGLGQKLVSFKDAE